MKRYIYSSLLIIICTLCIGMTTAHAAEFDPNLIISDEEMQDYNSMTRDDIQAFLADKGDFLEGFKTSDKDGTTRSAADIIYRAAQEYKINPKYILVKLQKEQSLITTNNPTQKQLDWATGYGVCDSCSMSDPKIQKYKGFGNQVDNAAGIIRWYYDNLSSQSWIKRANKTYVINNQEVRPATNATGFLYTYTPHIHGNKNFWSLWNLWFQQRYPNGSLVKGTTDKTVYLLQNEQRRPFKNNTALITRFDPKMIITIPDADLSQYPMGSAIALPNFAILRANDSYYLIDFDTVRKFESYEVVQRMGYNPDEIIDVTEYDLKEFTLGSTISLKESNPLGRIIILKGTENMYFLKDNNYYPITDSQIAKINFPSFDPQTVDSSELQDYEQGAAIRFKDGTILGIKGSNKIYVIENGNKRHIANEAVFTGLGFNWSNIIWTNELTGTYHPTGQPIYLNGNTSAAPIPTAKEIEPAQTGNTIKVEPTDQSSTEETITKSPTTDTNDPYADIAKLMVRTPKSELSYFGDMKYETEVETYLVGDFASGEILAGKNIDFVRPLASMTKVMTAYALLQDGLSLKDRNTVTYDPALHKSAYHRFRIAPGEAVKTADLMDALLVSSLNTPAKMLVSQVSPNETTFVARMNKQAQDWALTKTKFTDSYGYDTGNMGTARDYFRLMQNVFEEEPIIKNILGKKSYEYDEVLDLDGKPHHYDTNTNALANKKTEFTIIASKTGYLYESGSNLAMLVQRNSDKKLFVIITMGNADYANKFVEPEALTNWALKTF